MVVRTVSWVLLFASLGAAGAAWFTPTPELDADDASDLARDALGKAGVEVERIAPPVRVVHETEEGETVDAWRVRIDVEVDGDSEEIEVRVQQSAGRLVYLDDRIGPDNSEELLTPDQFAAFREHRDDTLADRWVLRNVLAAVAAVIIAATSYVLASRSDTLWSPR